MSERRPIVLVSSAHELAGAEVYLLSLLEALAGRVPLEVLASDRAPAELYRRIAATGVAATPVPGLARRPTVGATVRLARILRRRRPALVHVNLSDQGDGLAAIAAARLAGAPLSATLHIVLPERRAVLERVTRLALGQARAVLAVSDAVGGYLAANGVRATVVRNGVATPTVTADPRDQIGVSAGEFVVGGVGRLDGQKGWDLLCAAAVRVRQRVPGCRFVVIGEGRLREELAAAPGADLVEFIGYRERAAELIAGFDVLAVPSRYEGFGLVAVEAMLAGVPVVAAAVGGLPEVVGDAGLLVPPGDADALADALTTLALDGALRQRLAAAGGARARERFGHERMVEETLAAWDRAIGGAAARPRLVDSVAT